MSRSEFQTTPRRAGQRRSEFQAGSPQVGQRFVDWHGCEWTVQGTRSIGAADFQYAIVDVEYRAANGIPSKFKTSTAEFARLAAQGALKRLA